AAFLAGTGQRVRGGTSACRHRPGGARARGRTGTPLAAGARAGAGQRTGRTGGDERAARELAVAGARGAHAGAGGTGAMDARPAGARLPPRRWPHRAGCIGRAARAFRCATRGGADRRPRRGAAPALARSGRQCALQATQATGPAATDPASHGGARGGFGVTVGAHLRIKSGGALLHGDATGLLQSTRAGSTRSSERSSMLAWVRLRTLSFSKIAVTCAFTVRSWIASRSAICLLSRPSASRPSTRYCCPVRRASRA